MAAADFVVKRELHHNVKRNLCEGGNKEIIKIYQQAEVIRLGLPKIRKKVELFDKLHALKTPGIFRVGQVANYNDTIALVFKTERENTNYTTLEGYGPIIGLSNYVDVILQILNTFWNLHILGFVHNDVESACLLIDRNTQEVVLVDIGEPTEIGIGATLPGANSASEGILNYRYTSPEHTGRTRNVIDQRSDIYSLGVILYELAVGSPPFVASNPIELVHLHMSQPPPPLPSLSEWNQVEPNAGPIISSIIQKMLTKAPKDRYTTLYGVIRDFERIRDALSEKTPLLPFPIAEHDMEDIFHLPENKLYGRENEVQELMLFMEVFNSPSTSNSAMILVGGHPGVGKSTLIRHIYSHVYEKNASSGNANPPVLLSGKHDQIKHTPYSAIIEALKMVVQRLLSSKGYVEEGEREERKENNKINQDRTISK
jgi:serine/threonine protein kinase